MHENAISRRRFIGQATVLAGLAAVPSCRQAPPSKDAAAARVPTAADQVTLGKTGIRLSRLGMGCGSNSGNVQRSLGHEAFDSLVRYAYDHGITYFDTADGYKTHEWIREAIRGLPREKLYIQTKMGGGEKPLEEIDRFRKELGTDYIDSLLVHCMCTANWDEERKRLMDAIAEAQEKKLIRAKGASFHSLPALRRSVDVDWMDVHLVRINPQGAHIDTPAEKWDAKSDASHLPAALEEIRKLKARGRGIIGMKIIGNGDFTNPEDREKSIRFAMTCGLPDAVVIGFKSPAEIDEAIERMNRALAETVRPA